MNANILKQLSRKDIHRLAQRENIESNAKAEVIIEKLLKKYPDGVPRLVARAPKRKSTIQPIKEALATAMCQTKNLEDDKETKTGDEKDNKGTGIRYPAGSTPEAHGIDSTTTPAPRAKVLPEAMTQTSRGEPASIDKARTKTEKEADSAMKETAGSIVHKGHKETKEQVKSAMPATKDVFNGRDSAIDPPLAPESDLADGLTSKTEGRAEPEAKDKDRSIAPGNSRDTAGSKCAQQGVAQMNDKIKGKGIAVPNAPEAKASGGQTAPKIQSSKTNGRPAETEEERSAREIAALRRALKVAEEERERRKIEGAFPLASECELLGGRNVSPKTPTQLKVQQMTKGKRGTYQKSLLAHEMSLVVGTEPMRELPGWWMVAEENKAEENKVEAVAVKEAAKDVTKTDTDAKLVNGEGTNITPNPVTPKNKKRAMTKAINELHDKDGSLRSVLEVYARGSITVPHLSTAAGSDLARESAVGTKARRKEKGKGRAVPIIPPAEDVSVAQKDKQARWWAEAKKMENEAKAAKQAARKVIEEAAAATKAIGETAEEVAAQAVREIIRQAHSNASGGARPTEVPFDAEALVNKFGANKLLGLFLDGAAAASDKVLIAKANRLYKGKQMTIKSILGTVYAEVASQRSQTGGVALISKAPAPGDAPAVSRAGTPTNFDFTFIAPRNPVRSNAASPKVKAATATADSVNPAKDEDADTHSLGNSADTNSQAPPACSVALDSSSAPGTNAKDESDEPTPVEKAARGFTDEEEMQVFRHMAKMAGDVGEMRRQVGHVAAAEHAARVKLQTAQGALKRVRAVREMIQGQFFELLKQEKRPGNGTHSGEQLRKRELASYQKEHSGQLSSSETGASDEATEKPDTSTDKSLEPDGTPTKDTGCSSSCSNKAQGVDMTDGRSAPGSGTSVMAGGNEGVNDDGGAADRGAEDEGPVAEEDAKRGQDGSAPDDGRDKTKTASDGDASATKEDDSVSA